MKQSFEGASSVVYGDVEQRKFGLAMGSKIFLILSDKLYSDKILAPIRELICNARDAHIEAGTTDKKFIVHLPTRKEPYFSVRDFGTGLTHEEVINLYTVYGMTTKDDTNKAIGCWGLGSKSPFAYTDRFEVFSYKDGTLNVYDCRMSGGEPIVTKFDTCETVEPNGLEVKFDVRDTDFDNFRNRLRKMVFLQKYMDVKYDYTYEFPKEPERKGIIYDFQESCYDSYLADDINVEMGGVIYRVPYAHGQSSVLDEFKSKSCKRVIIHADLGAVDVTTSREQLDMTDKTYDYLNKVLSEFMAGMMNRVKEAIKAEPNVLLKLLRYKQMRLAYGSFAYIFKLDRWYRQFIDYAGTLSISSVITHESKARNTCIANLLRSFDDACNEALAGKYPTFVDCSSKYSLPPEIRAAVKAKGEDLHCIRDIKTLNIIKRFNIPVHSLEEYKEYKPVRTYCGGPRKKVERKPGELIRSGLSTKELNHSLDSVAFMYSQGRKIWWCRKDELDHYVGSAPVLVNSPEGLRGGYGYESTVSSLLYSVGSCGVIVNSDAAERRISNDPLFVHLPTKIKEFLKDNKRIKRAVEYYVVNETYKRLGKYSSYGKDLCDFFYKYLSSSERRDWGRYKSVLPYVKKAISGKKPDESNEPEWFVKDIVEFAIDSSVSSVMGIVEDRIIKYVRENLPLLYPYLDYYGHKSPRWGEYYCQSGKDVEEDMRSYIRTVVKRLKKAEKEKQVENTNEEKKEN